MLVSTPSCVSRSCALNCKCAVSSPPAQIETNASSVSNCLTTANRVFRNCWTSPLPKSRWKVKRKKTGWSANSEPNTNSSVISTLSARSTKGVCFRTLSSIPSLNLFLATAPKASLISTTILLTPQSSSSISSATRWKIGHTRFKPARITRSKSVLTSCSTASRSLSWWAPRTQKTSAVLA